MIIVNFDQTCVLQRKLMLKRFGGHHLCTATLAQNEMTCLSLSTNTATCFNNKSSFFNVLLTVPPCIISQINPTRCTILFNIFIYYSSLHVSGIHVSIIRRKLLYLCDTGTCHSVCVVSGLLVGLIQLIQSNQQTRRHTYRVTSASVA